MFDKCITCPRLGESCVPNLFLLPFPELIKWCSKRQKYLGWTNQVFSDMTARVERVPVGTINRIKAGEEDCKFSTMRIMLITLIGGTTNEFECTELVEKELQHMEQLTKQAEKLATIERENELLKSKLLEIDNLHRQDIRAVRDEYQGQIEFLKEELKAWRLLHQK